MRKVVFIEVVEVMVVMIVKKGTVMVVMIELVVFL